MTQKIGAKFKLICYLDGNYEFDKGTGAVFEWRKNGQLISHSNSNSAKYRIESSEDQEESRLTIASLGFEDHASNLSCTVRSADLSKSTHATSDTQYTVLEVTGLILTRLDVYNRAMHRTQIHLFSQRQLAHHCRSATWHLPL